MSAAIATSGVLVTIRSLFVRSNVPETFESVLIWLTFDALPLGETKSDP